MPRGGARAEGVMGRDHPLSKNFSKDKDVASMARMARIRRERTRQTQPRDPENSHAELQQAVIRRLARGRS